MLTVETQIQRIQELEREIETNQARVNYAYGALEEARRVMADLKQSEPVELKIIEPTESTG